ncbi:hypothetical protein JRQ81_005541 [Phrynocephalus forsythii]|uniref:HTH OST-type domain-containing protein n=1 Tax=Phrynocephalus forsythii TaxID=171643 RepID=A0A9Q0XGF6_9SAUR|nr:hypothetical protein JRQ81_005541 [Phrynocephalus forsythii]
MAFDERDPRDLKLHVLLLLLEHPQGISFGDFSGAFHQLHGYHPHISLYGYSSLRQLIADMKDLVVVEGSSGTPVMKFIKGLTLDNWPEVENGLQCSAEEPRCLMNGEKAEQQPVGLADVLVALTNLLAEYKSGLRIKKLQEFLLARDGTDLEKFSINHGYKDTLEFLEAQMPELSILYQENQVKCVVQLMADASASSASATIQNSVEEPVSQAPGLSDILAAVLKLLAKYKWGLKVKKLQDLLLAEGGVDLEKFSISHGNKDTLEFLEVQMPELNIQYKENHLSCVVMLPTEGLPDILVAVSNLLAKYKLGLKIKTLQELLLARDGIDLKKISNTHGYKDTLEFLEAQMPELHIQYKANRLSCLVQLHTEDLSDTLAAITNILGKYKLGLKIKKLQELLLAEEGIDLEKFSISHGNKGTLQFLEVWMPELNIQYKENHLSCVVQLPADICVSSASSNVQNNGKEPAGQPPVPCIPVPALESDSSACISNPAPSGQERRKTGTSSPAPCPGTVFPTCNSDAVSQKLTETKSGVTASSAPDDIQNGVELPRKQAPELSVPFFLIRDILQGHPHGLKLKKLKKALNKNYKFNLETFCSDLGYKDVTSCLQDISGLLVRNITKCKNCVVQLESRACSPAPSLDSDFSACCSDTTTSWLTRPEFGAPSLAPHPDFCAFNADAVPQKPLATSSGKVV